MVYPTNMAESKYQVYIRNNWPLPFVQPWAFGPTNLAKPPFRWKVILVANLGYKYAWAYEAKDLFKTGHEIDSFLMNLKNLKQFEHQAKQIEIENRKFAQNISKINLAKLSIKELVDLLKKWYNTHNCFAKVFMSIDATDETLENDIKSELVKNGNSLSIHDFAALLTPDAATYVQREHKDFCLLAKRYWKKFRSPAARKAIANHKAKWWWTNMGWGQHKPMNEKEIIKNLLNIKDLNALLTSQKHEEYSRNENLKLKRTIVKKLPIKAKRLLNAFEVLAEMHDTRKEIQMRMMSEGLKITKQLLNKSNLPFKFRDFLLMEEYFNLAIGKKPALLELERREKIYWCEFKAGEKFLMLSGKKALGKIKKYDIEGLKNKQDSKTLTGLPASPGIAKGKARVELNAKILNRTIKPGEILVTSQTTPEFAPAMKKAAAIITDEGGITSHAAIVSRELGIPCVIGTKVATKVFKDGDIIEVDANKGIVRKIK